MSELILQIYCPICGRPTHIKTWDSFLRRSIPKAFGFIQRSKGRGNIEKLADIHIEQAPEIFEKIKDRMLGVLGYWVFKGYVSSDEVKRLLDEFEKAGIEYYLNGYVALESHENGVIKDYLSVFLQ